MPDGFLVLLAGGVQSVSPFLRVFLDKFSSFAVGKGAGGLFLREFGHRCLLLSRNIDFTGRAEFQIGRLITQIGILPRHLTILFRSTDISSRSTTLDHRSIQIPLRTYIQRIYLSSSLSQVLTRISFLLEFHSLSAVLPIDGILNAATVDGLLLSGEVTGQVVSLVFLAVAP